MSRRLLQLVIPVTPERRMFRIHDPTVDPDAPGGPLPPVGALISTNREQLWVGSLQEDIDVRLVLEEWDEAPPPCGDAWDEEAKGSIYLRGQLSISMGLAGTAVRGLRLAGGVGDYSLRVYAGNRDQVTRRYAQLFDRHRNPLSDEFQQEKKTLEGLERYLVQLWRESLATHSPGLRSLAGLTAVPAATGRSTRPGPPRDRWLPDSQAPDSRSRDSRPPGPGWYPCYARPRARRRQTRSRSCSPTRAGHCAAGRRFRWPRLTRCPRTPRSAWRAYARRARGTGSSRRPSARPSPRAGP